MKNFLKILSWFLIIAGLIVSLGFVRHEQRNLLVSDLKIFIDNETENEFIDLNDIREIIFNSGDSVVGRSIAGIDVGLLEKLIENHPSVAGAEVFKTINGEINVSVKQRKPLIRIFPLNGEGFYIDEEGAFMPLSNKYSARVLMANGYIHGSINVFQNLDIKQILKNDSLSKKTLLDDLYILAGFIRNDPFWNAQVQQVYINESREMELIPRVGNHKIILGDISDMEEKFDRLMIFYKNGLSKTGWNEYETINLKYKNQIVCTKI